MERNVHYIFVGFFISMVALGFTGFLIWFTSSYDLKNHARYTVIFPGTVNGLSEGSKVRYLGIEVGQVTNLRLDKTDSGQVKVDIRILKKTPVRSGTTAVLKPQGITGLSFVSLKTNPQDQNPPDNIKGEKYPVIQGSESQLDKILKKLPDIADNLSTATERIEQTLSEKNVSQITEILGHMEQLSVTLNEKTAPAMDNMTDTLKEIRKTAQASQSLIRTSEKAVDRFDQTLQGVAPAIESVNALTSRLDRLTRENEHHIDYFLGKGLLEGTLLLEQSRRSMAEIEKLGEKLAEKPSRLIFDTGYKGLKIPQ